MKSIRLLTYCIIFSAALLPAAAAAQNGAKQTAVFVSREIRPFVEVTNGICDQLRDELGGSADVYYLKRLQEMQAETVRKKMSDAGYRVFLAVGPAAAEYVWQELPETRGKKLYAAILNPRKHIPAPSPEVCGVPLNIPVSEQIRAIHQGLPQARRIGILFDPENNEDFYAAAAEAGAKRGLSVEPLRARAKKEIPEILRSRLDAVDAIWLIPDATIISETLIEYIIKTSLLRQTPVVGYNQFFHASGAALSFVFDYYEIGRQGGRRAADVLRGSGCRTRTPAYDVWLNQRIYRQAGLRLPENPPARFKVKP